MPAGLLGLALRQVLLRGPQQRRPLLPPLRAAQGRSCRAGASGPTLPTHLPHPLPSRPDPHGVAMQARSSRRSRGSHKGSPDAESQSCLGGNLPGDTAVSLGTRWRAAEGETP